MDSVFFQSVLVTPPQIMGVQLRPFSAYHALVLLQFDSPFAEENGDIEAGDLIFALNVLSSKFGASPKVKGGLLFWKVLFARKKTLRKAISDIHAHIDGYAQHPDIWAKEGGKESSVPWPFRVVATIMRRFSGFSEQEAWDMGLSKAACYRACHAEDCGADVFNEWGVEGQHKRWIKSPDYAKYKTLEEFLEAEKANG